MQIHLFISEKASAGNRLKNTLQAPMRELPVIQYNRPDAFGRVVPIGFNDPAVAVIMVAETGELAPFLESGYIRDWFKTILVIPDCEPETIHLCHSLRPIFITHMDSDFSEVADILEHIRRHMNEKPENPNVEHRTSNIEHRMKTRNP